MPEMSAIPEEQRHWTVDKRVPIALIVTIIIQSAGIIWWASELSSRVASLEEYRGTTVSFDSRIVRLETNAENIRQALQIISDKLDRLIERRQ